jgi:hypothetical protein
MKKPRRERWGSFICMKIVAGIKAGRALTGSIGELSMMSTEFHQLCNFACLNIPLEFSSIFWLRG